MDGVMVIWIVVDVAHWPALGVKVYVDVPGVAVFICAGLQVPEIPLLDVEGNAGAVVFWHTGAIGENDGVT